MEKDQLLNDFKYQDDFIKRRVYQLKNHEEVYKKYSNRIHNVEWNLAQVELQLMVLSNMILDAFPEPSKEDYDNIYLQAIDMVYGGIDTEAINLMIRCDSDKNLPLIHER